MAEAQEEASNSHARAKLGYGDLFLFFVCTIDANTIIMFHCKHSRVVMLMMIIIVMMMMTTSRRNTTSATVMI